MNDDTDAPDEEPVPEPESEPPRDPYPWLTDVGQKTRLWLWDGYMNKFGLPDAAKLRELDMNFEWVSSRGLPPPETKLKSIK